MLSQLTECLRDPEEYVRDSAAKALGRLGAAAARQPVLSRLIGCLGDPGVLVRHNAAEALGRFLRGGVRWFAGRRGALVVRTVASLSGEA